MDSRGGRQSPLFRNPTGGPQVTQDLSDGAPAMLSPDPASNTLTILLQVTSTTTNPRAEDERVYRKQGIHSTEQQSQEADKFTLR